jgi:glycosyltransferase involved in cell wall biosynthesis
MKIILANKFYYPRGGDCIYTMELEKLLIENGHEVAIFSMKHPKNFKSDFTSYFPSEVDYSKRNILGLFKFFIRPIYSREVSRKFQKLLNEFNPDIIHLNNIHSHLSPVLAQIAYSYKIPVIWTMHDYKLACPSSAFLRNNKICTLCIQDKKSVLKFKCHKNSYLISLLAYFESVRWSSKRINQYTSKFIAPSKFLKTILYDIKIPEEKITAMPNFVNFDINKVQLKRDNYIVYLGRLSKEKGIYSLLNVIKELPEFHLKVIGNGPLYKDLKLNLSLNNVEYLGFIEHDIIFNIISKAKFLVIPSEWFDNNPLTVIEALICGTPVLGSKIGGIPEMINSTNGLLFNPFDSVDLKEKIIAINNISFDYECISKEAKEKFSSKKYYDNIFKIYKKIIKDGISK